VNSGLTGLSDLLAILANLDTCVYWFSRLRQQYLLQLLQIQVAYSCYTFKLNFASGFCDKRNICDKCDKRDICDKIPTNRLFEYADWLVDGCFLLCLDDIQR